MTESLESFGGERQAAALISRILNIGRALRARGFAVAMSDTLDAVNAAQVVGVADRELLRAALRSTLVKTPDPTRAFDEIFDRWLPRRRVGTNTAIDPLDDEAMARAIGGTGDLGELAAALVAEHGGFDGDDIRSERHHAQRVMRAADLARLMALALRSDLDPTAVDVQRRIEELKRQIAAEVRERLGPGDDDDGPDLDVTNVEFLNASRAQFDAMRAEVRPLARRIATKLARRRQRASDGVADLRRTARRSLATGGVPLDVATRRRRPQRPELFVLCDISGSVAEFSLFTLTLMSALSAELPHTRSFVFVDAVDEITTLLQATSHSIEPWQILRNTRVIGASGHSDYGEVFEQFWQRYGESDLTRRSTVLIAGDARCNYKPAHATTLGKIAQRTRAVYWLNPESKLDWYTHDSAMEAYEAYCRRTFEVRDLAGLAHSIDQIL